MANDKEQHSTMTRARASNKQVRFDNQMKVITQAELDQLNKHAKIHNIADLISQRHEELATPQFIAQQAKEKAQAEALKKEQEAKSKDANNTTSTTTTAASSTGAPTPTQQLGKKSQIADPKSLEEQDYYDSMKFQKVFELKDDYHKNIQPCYEGSLKFSFSQTNYEIRERDIKFLQKNKLKIKPELMEKIIDVFEKINYADKKQSFEHIKNNFAYRAGNDLYKKVQADLKVVFDWWLSEREKWSNRPLLKIFWDTQDYDNNDHYKSMKTRQHKKKMDLRPQAKKMRNTYQQMHKIRANEVIGLRLAQQMHKRDLIQKQLQAIENLQFDLQYAIMMREKGQEKTNCQLLSCSSDKNFEVNLQQKIDEIKKKIEIIQNDFSNPQDEQKDVHRLEIKVLQDRPYHQDLIPQLPKMLDQYANQGGYGQMTQTPKGGAQGHGGSQILLKDGGQFLDPNMHNLKQPKSTKNQNANSLRNNQNPIIQVGSQQLEPSSKTKGRNALDAQSQNQDQDTSAKFKTQNANTMPQPNSRHGHKASKNQQSQQQSNSNVSLSLSTNQNMQEESKNTQGTSETGDHTRGSSSQHQNDTKVSFMIKQFNEPIPPNSNQNGMGSQQNYMQSGMPGAQGPQGNSQQNQKQKPRMQPKPKPQHYTNPKVYMGEALSTLDMVTILTKFMQESDKTYGFQSQLIGGQQNAQNQQQHQGVNNKNGPHGMNGATGNNQMQPQGVKVSYQKDFNYINMMIAKAEKQQNSENGYYNSNGTGLAGAGSNINGSSSSGHYLVSNKRFKTSNQEDFKETAENKPQSQIPSNDKISDTKEATQEAKVIQKSMSEIKLEEETKEREREQEMEHIMERIIGQKKHVLVRRGRNNLMHYDIVNQHNLKQRLQNNKAHNPHTTYYESKVESIKNEQKSKNTGVQRVYSKNQETLDLLDSIMDKRSQKQLRKNIARCTRQQIQTHPSQLQSQGGQSPPAVSNIQSMLTTQDNYQNTMMPQVPLSAEQLALAQNPYEQGVYPFNKSTQLSGSLACSDWTVQTKSLKAQSNTDPRNLYISNKLQQQTENQNEDEGNQAANLSTKEIEYLDQHPRIVKEEDYNPALASDIHHRFRRTLDIFNYSLRKPQTLEKSSKDLVNEFIDPFLQSTHNINNTTTTQDHFTLLQHCLSTQDNDFLSDQQLTSASSTHNNKGDFSNNFYGQNGSQYANNGGFNQSQSQMSQSHNQFQDGPYNSMMQRQPLYGANVNSQFQHNSQYGPNGMINNQGNIQISNLGYHNMSQQQASNQGGLGFENGGKYWLQGQNKALESARKKQEMHLNHLFQHSIPEMTQNSLKEETRKNQFFQKFKEFKKKSAYEQANSQAGIPDRRPSQPRNMFQNVNAGLPNGGNAQGVGGQADMSQSLAN